LHYCTKDNPKQNDILELFNGRPRDECLNEKMFASYRNAKHTIEDLRNS
jgi:putative transposase